MYVFHVPRLLKNIIKRYFVKHVKHCKLYVHENAQSLNKVSLND